jgi:hypothetical protein
MKTKHIAYGIAAILVASSLTFTSCRKKDKTPAAEPDTEQSTSTDNNTAESNANDVDAMGSQLSESSGTLTTFRTTEADLMMAAGATVTAAFNGTNVTGYTLDFGTTGITGTDGRIRTGKLIYDFSTSASLPTRYRFPGFKMTVSSQNYVVDGNSVAITKTVTNTTPSTIPTGTNPGTNLTWAITANVTIVKSGNSGTISWACTRTKELTNTNDPACYKGQLLPIDWTKAIIKLNGNASGTNAKGESFTSTSTNLIRSFVCAPNANQPHRHPFIGGQISYTPGNRPNRLIDFGNGTDCDFNATITINGQTYAFLLQ